MPFRILVRVLKHSLQFSICKIKTLIISELVISKVLTRDSVTISVDAVVYYRQRFLFMRMVITIILIIIDLFVMIIHRFLGIVLLLEFILFDRLRLFFIFLTGCNYVDVLVMMMFSTIVMIMKHMTTMMMIILVRNWNVDVCAPLPQSNLGCPHSQELYQDHHHHHPLH